MTNEERIEKLALAIYWMTGSGEPAAEADAVISDIRKERESKEPLTCPFCGGTLSGAHEYSNGYYVHCSCGFYSPYRATADEVRAAVRKVRVEDLRGARG